MKDKVGMAGLKSTQISVIPAKLIKSSSEFAVWMCMQATTAGVYFM